MKMVYLFAAFLVVIMLALFAFLTYMPVSAFTIAAAMILAAITLGVAIFCVYLTYAKTYLAIKDVKQKVKDKIHAEVGKVTAKKADLDVNLQKIQALVDAEVDTIMNALAGEVASGTVGTANGQAEVEHRRERLKDVIRLRLQTAKTVTPPEFVATDGDETKNEIANLVRAFALNQVPDLPPDQDKMWGIQVKKVRPYLWLALVATILLSLFLMFRVGAAFGRDLLSRSCIEFLAASTEYVKELSLAVKAREEADKCILAAKKLRTVEFKLEKDRRDQLRILTYYTRENEAAEKRHSEKAFKASLKIKEAIEAAQTVASSDLQKKWEAWKIYQQEKNVRLLKVDPSLLEKEGE